MFHWCNPRGLVAGNIYGVMKAPIITTFLFGTGDRKGGTEEQARSDELCQKIAEEGIVLLKNQENALPLETKDLTSSVGHPQSKDFFSQESDLVLRPFQMKRKSHC